MKINNLCLAIPGKVIKIKGRQATVQYPGQTQPALISDEKVKLGDYVMVQMGIVVKILTKKEIDYALQSWQNN